MTYSYTTPDPIEYQRPDEQKAVQGPGIDGRSLNPQQKQEISNANRINEINKEIKVIDDGLKVRYTQKANYEKLLKDDPTNVTYQNLLADVKSQITADLQKKNALINERNQRQFQVTQKQKPTAVPKDTQKSNTDGTLKPKNLNPITYKYNAPMVKSAYFTGVDLQSSVSSLGVIPANDVNIDSLWTSVQGSKGTLQTSRNHVFSSNANKNTKNSPRNTQLYGFRFHYNPTSISMGWGLNMDVSPEYMMQMGTQTAVPLAFNSTASNIQLELALNRVHDLSYVRSNGTVIGNPYPHSRPDTQDAKMLYNRGTMYDIEYLFRAIMGPDSIFTSAYNGQTADKGLLWAVPLEISLGRGMRYLVRVKSLEVNHVMFNQRMVPIFSTVRIGIDRYYDGPGIYINQDGQAETATNTNSVTVRSTSPGGLGGVGGLTFE